MRMRNKSEKHALLCALTHAAGFMTLGRGVGIRYITENSETGRLAAELAVELYGVQSMVSLSRQERLKANSTIVTLAGSGCIKLLEDAGCILRESDDELVIGHIPEILLSNDTDRRCFLRGVFLGAGSVSDPKKGYHLELVCKYEPFAQGLCELLDRYEIHAKYLPRKGGYVVYLKEGNLVSDFLALIGAMSSTLAFEEARIIRSVNNNVNRINNFDDANMNKAAAAAAQQSLDIELIRMNGEWERLPAKLKEAAELRLNNPEATLMELAEMAGVSKSGLNHRLAKLSNLAEELRLEKGKPI